MTCRNHLAYRRVQEERRCKKPALPNRTSQSGDVAGELALREETADATLCAMKSMLPRVLKDLSKIKDHRKKNVRHPLALLMAYGIFMFALHYSSRRETNREMTDPMLRENLKALFPELGSMPHGDTLYRLLDQIEVEKIEEAQIRLLKRMMANKKFQGYLAEGKYRIAIDGTQKLARKGEWGDDYLLRHVGADGEAQSYVYVLEAALVLGSGMVIPFMSEFLTNRDIGGAEDSPAKRKQDCERKAFRRLAARIKAEFPRLRLVLMMDSLYANGPVFEICRKNNWDFMINYKPGSIPTVYEEAEALILLTPENTKEVMWGNRRQTYRFMNGIDYEYRDGETGKQSRFKLNVVKCEEEWQETRADGSVEEHRTTYVWLSAKPITKGNVFRRCTQIARYRWQIESNILVEKHQGYNYEHSYATRINALKGYHYLAKIAHMIMTIVMMSAAVLPKVKAFGKRGFVRYLKKCLTGNVLELARTRSNAETYLQLIA